MTPPDDDLQPDKRSPRTRLVTLPPPGFANKAARFAWGLVWLLLFRPSPRVAHGWRRMLLRGFGANIAPGAKIYPSARIWAPWNLAMGPGSTLGDFADCYSVAQITIGERATVSQRAFLCSATRNLESPGMALMAAPITIEPQAWVAAEAYVAPGVIVGEGGVAAARAVATRDIGAWTIVAGNPARPIRRRPKS